jgi:hypothetical protein
LRKIAPALKLLPSSIQRVVGNFFSGIGALLVCPFPALIGLALIHCASVLRLLRDDDHRQEKQNCDGRNDQQRAFEGKHFASDTLGKDDYLDGLGALAAAANHNAFIGGGLASASVTTETASAWAKLRVSTSWPQTGH